VSDEVLLVERRGAVALLTMNRPERRNALNRALIRALVDTVAEIEADPSCHVSVLTGVDPAFCAGVDLKEVAGPSGGAPVHRDPWPGPFPPHAKPIIGAVNGPVATGGLEIALNCDFLVASERAAFVDTHVKVNVMPGWGLTVLLPQRVGLARAKEMSLTSNFVDAPTAFGWGLVNHVVAHEDLLPVTLGLAADVAAQELAPMLRIRQTYDEVSSTTVGEGWPLELAESRAWEPAYDLSSMDDRRRELMARARAQRPPGG